LLLVSLVHVYWAARGVASGASVPSHADGTPVFRPGRVATLLVAMALMLGALIVLVRAQLLDVQMRPIVLRVGIWGLAAAFAARTVGEFRYVGLFKRVSDTPFARWDTRLFTPLCAIIAFAAALVATTSP
jgi:hypothetical protein